MVLVHVNASIGTFFVVELEFDQHRPPGTLNSNLPEIYQDDMGQEQLVYENIFRTNSSCLGLIFGEIQGSFM